ncbi:response regulator receiver protein [Lysobacter sp. TY2-98]|uniref:AfsR/SARP family transcriptional regulator n=1 Tax=Lysobacter sp. TY2-98 TaxID=2290922 RepID=UPI000E20233C|nr:BTAD domain-containing putative transcriptional regulator [Lysobacter sp. TY2-98]AXK73615.1 response regulator receiver protein [Lysobacter sp. TY2-98]
MLRISLFGSMALATGPESAPEVAVAGRSASLLAYLALGHGRSFSRSELLASLWPDPGASATAGSFNTALWRLRRLLEAPPLAQPGLITTDRRGGIALCPQADVWLDVAEFDDLVEPRLARPVERLTDEDVDALERGVRLYKADLLIELSDDWALRARERYRRNFLNALYRLMQIATIRRQYLDGIGHAQRILDHDPLREDVHRDLMQLFVASGQRALALRQFEHCRELLRRELAIQPMRETQALYRRIADSAVGLHAGGDAPASGERRRATDIALPPMTKPFAIDPTSRDAGMEPLDLLHGARAHLAAADAQLQLSLRLLN